MSIPTHIAIKATTNAQKIQNAGVTPEVIVSPARAASADEIPNCDGATCSPSCTTAEMACAAMAMMAPARNAAPATVGRHKAATTTTATSAIMAARSPAITAPGLENAFPAVSEFVTPADVRRVKLSHDGANEAAAPSAASVSARKRPIVCRCGRSRCSRRLPSESDRPAGRTGEPSDQAEYQAGAHEMSPSGNGGAGVGEEEPEGDSAHAETQECANPQPGAPEHDEERARRPDGQVDRVRHDLGRLLGQARPSQIVREEPDDPEHDAEAEETRGNDGVLTGRDGSEAA
jgi:hypothetical protein